MPTECKWLSTETTEVPKDHKVLIRRGDKIFYGKFYYRNYRNKKVYFIVDGGSVTMSRRGDWWCDLPESLLADPSL